MKKTASVLYCLFIYRDEGVNILDFGSLKALMEVKKDMEKKGYFCSWQMAGIRVS
jgi:hypothetical protein